MLLRFVGQNILSGIGCRNLYRISGAKVKTTLNLDDALLAQAKVIAVQRRTTLTRLIEEGLRLHLFGKPAAAQAIIPVYHGQGGLLPGLDGLSNKAMFEAADA